MFDSLNLKNVENVMNFAGRDLSFKANDEIPLLQTKGVFALCKILQNRQYAYLADEVGMGKTYQAIGVISMFLREKPNARILVIAPNRNVQNNWLNEINNVRKNNLQENIAISVKNYEERKQFISCFNEEQNEGIFLTRISLFSSIADSVLKYGTENYVASEQININDLLEGLANLTSSEKMKGVKGEFDSTESGKICGYYLKKYTKPFDFVVIDEAQNLRNSNNATTFLSYWLGLKAWKDDVAEKTKNVIKNLPLTKSKDTKYLLLSATPAHRSIESLRNQLFYFENRSDVPCAGDFSRDFLQNFFIRRLRTYGNQNKYDVRNVVPSNILNELNLDNQNGQEQRLFLALVQSKLAQLQSKYNANFKIGFLETFESYDPISKNGVAENEDGDDDSGKEFENGGSSEKDEKGAAPDKEMLVMLAKSYAENFGRKIPPHPKLRYMEKEIKEILDYNLPNNMKKDVRTPEKAVVFVRRLASVDELNRQFNKQYEDKIVAYWGKIFAMKNAGLKDVQQKFEEGYNKKTSRNGVMNEYEDDDIDVEEDLQTKSKLLSWLAIKKHHGRNEFNAVSRFKKSMLSNKPNSTLFCENYFRLCHTKETNSIFSKTIRKLVDDDFVKEVNSFIEADPKRYIIEYSGKRRLNSNDLLVLCCHVALSKENYTEMAQNIKQFYDIKDKEIYSGNKINKQQIKDILGLESLWNFMPSFGVELNKENVNFYKRESLKCIVEKYLKSSEVVLDLLYCYIYYRRRDLCKSIVKRLFDSNSPHGYRIKKIFENGNLVYKQLLGSEVYERELELRSKLGFLDLQQWVMPAVGGNKGNEGTIKRFNTPFYPDIIVCTDVLKEGINLHLFCNRVYHYGLAWTPGDLEQRVGRVDRFFSKVHRERTEENFETKIEIIYPYLGKSIDEHQLKRVLQFRLSADPLLDSKIQSPKDIQIDLDEFRSVEQLAEYKPKEGERTNFPYSGDLFLNE